MVEETKVEETKVEAKGQDGDGPQEPPNGQGSIIRMVGSIPYIFNWNGYTYVNSGIVAGSSGGGDDLLQTH